MFDNRIPSIEVESAQGIREISLSTRHLMRRKIFLTGDINAEMANTFLSQLMFLKEESNAPVSVYINSPGGEVGAGLMIYDAICTSGLTIKTICTGMAASMAAVIFAGGTKGHRSILKHSRVMIHEPLIGSPMGGSASSIKNISDSIMETKNMINQILADHTGKSLEEINEITKDDYFMNAEEAIEFGICDKVVTSLS